MSKNYLGKRSVNIAISRIFLIVVLAIKLIHQIIFTSLAINQQLVNREPPFLFAMEQLFTYSVIIMGFISSTMSNHVASTMFAGLYFANCCLTLIKRRSQLTPIAMLIDFALFAIAMRYDKLLTARSLAKHNKNKHNNNLC